MSCFVMTQQHLCNIACFKGNKAVAMGRLINRMSYHTMGTLGQI